VARVRRILHEKKVGHAGTLDPMATGLLVLAVGPSTRLLRFAQSETKRYSGAVKFGVATDSLDADGVVVERRSVPVLTRELLDATTSAMLGSQRQTPPMVSAIKIDGQRLHQLARRGVEVERSSREISVATFTLSPTDDATVWRFDVVCSVGTYVRVLLSDLAVALGTVGHLVELRRLASGAHSVENALTLDELAVNVGDGREVLAPPATFVTALEHVALRDEQASAMRMGQRVALEQKYEGDEIAAMDSFGNLVGILQRRNDSWKPELVLASRDDSTRG
jgi:tRNA pseudouridine55 synthase